MTPKRIIRQAGKFTAEFAADQSGAVAAYVVILLAVFVGFVGLAVDVGRLYTTHSQAQFAADAAAMAAATQLDGKDGAIQRATIAAQTTPLVNNDQDFAQGDATVQIVQLRFLHSLPPHDDMPITNKYVTNKDSEAAYVEATTETLSQINLFLAAVGVPTNDATAVAVAGNTTMTCKVPPLMICNPWESSNDTRTVDELNDDLRGVTLLAKTVEGSVDSWAPGAMALLDPPPTWDPDTQTWDTSTNNGTKKVAEALARVPLDFCYPEMPLSVRTGQANAMRSAVNIWFDIYENPFFGAAKYRRDADFRPAQNVTKGWITQWVEEDVLDADGNVIGTDTFCESTPADDPNVAFGLPPDDCFAPSDDPLNWFNPVPCDSSVGPMGSESRIGDGNWNIQHYWQINHPDLGALPSGSTETAANCETENGEKYCVNENSTRYSVYMWEILSGNIPNRDVDGTPAVEGENGNPICYEGDPSTLSNQPDRRKLSVAVINCQELGITGNSVPNMEAEFFADMFVLRPIRGQSDYNIWLEFIEFSESGDEAVHDLIQLYR